MTFDYGQPPRSGFARLVPELLVTDLSESLAFWLNALGFKIAYQRPEHRFAYLERPEGAQIMRARGPGTGKRERWSFPLDAAQCSRFSWTTLTPSPLPWRV
jgi:hypothetical protein